MKKFFRKQMLMILSVLLFAATPLLTAQPQAEHELVVLHTNDHHGHPVSFYDYPAPGQGGLPARATLVNETRDMYDNVMVVDAGDFNTGRPESTFFKGEPDIIGYNYIGYDLLTMGNHELDPSPSQMQKQIAMSEFPWLCANVKQADGSYIDNVKPYIIKDYGRFKVAVLGLMSKYTAETGSPDNIKGLIFEDEVETARKLVPMLKTKADLVIAVVHMGIYDDENLGSKLLAKEVADIALVIDGHTHTKVEEPVIVINKITGNEVPVVQAKHWGLYMGKIKMTFTKHNLREFSYELLPVNVKKREKKDDGTSVYHFVGKEYKEDEKLSSRLQVYVDKVDAVLNEVIGTATAPFFNKKTRNEETAIGDMVADSMLWYTDKMKLDADFAFQNGGGIRTDIADGPLQKRDIYEVLPFDNSVMVVTMKGRDVKALFDKTPETVGHGAMPQVSYGVSFTINTKTGTAEDIKINGQPINENKNYRIATNSYLASGGDGYKMFKNKTEAYDSSVMQRDAFIDYVISLGGIISPEVKGRIIVK